MAIAKWVVLVLLSIVVLAACFTPGCTSGQASHDNLRSAESRATADTDSQLHPFRDWRPIGVTQSHMRPADAPSMVTERSLLDYPMAWPTGDRSSPPASPRTPVSTANEELWIIERPATEVRGPISDDFPGCGALMTRIPGGTDDIPVPLKHTAVQASITGFIAGVNITQQFHNPFGSKIEAVYVFPLPENAAITEFVMTIGERQIRGIIREREEAQRVYQQARSQGYRASLLTQERPNIFTQSVANIEPGKQIDIALRYFQTLAYHDGAYEFSFPMVVGPRFNPPGTTDGIAALPRGTTGRSGKATEVQYLRPSERRGRDVSIRVDIDAGVALERIQSRSHVIAVNHDSVHPSRAAVVLSQLDAIPNKDFTLRYTVAGEGIKSALIAQPDTRPGRENDGYFALMIIPPAGLNALPRSPIDIVMVIDRSGSMSGTPLEQVKSAAARGLRRLEPGDTFQVLDFSENVSQFGNYALEANRRNIQSAVDYIGSMSAGGGTYMLPGMRAALALPHDRERLRFIAFLTDGYIGNEAEVLSELGTSLGDARIFGFGVGSSPNRHLIDSMSRKGRGAVAYLSASDPATDIMDLFMDRISRPAMANISFDFGSARISEMYPSRTPDLFVGRPVIMTGRYEGTLDGVRIIGSAGGREVITSAGSARADNLPQGPLLGAAPLAAVWARMKITELAERSLYDAAARAEAPGEILRTALDYGLMSPYTAFVAVDSLERTEGTFGTTVAVPVPVPEGVRYETTVPVHHLGTPHN